MFALFHCSNIGVVAVLPAVPADVHFEEYMGERVMIQRTPAEYAIIPGYPPSSGRLEVAASIEPDSAHGTVNSWVRAFQADNNLDRARLETYQAQQRAQEEQRARVEAQQRAQAVRAAAISALMEVGLSNEAAEEMIARQGL